MYQNHTHLLTGEKKIKTTSLKSKVSCSISGCERFAEKRGFCNYHYQLLPFRLKQHDDRKFFSMYGITRDQRDQILAKQGGVCALCKATVSRWQTDHDHLDGHIRGILCTGCNLWLGKFETSDRANRSSAYLLCPLAPEYIKIDASMYSKTKHIRSLITDAQYFAMLRTQNGLCGICRASPLKQDLAVDHNHTTGIVRGLLCFSCNTWLSRFERPDFLDRVISYLSAPSPVLLLEMPINIH